MSKGAGSFMKGMGMGVVAGITASAVTGMMVKKNQKSFRKTATQAVRAVGDFADNVQKMIK